VADRFLHSHKGHVLKDVAKFENDLLYILTPVHNEKDLILAMEFTDALVGIKDLATCPIFTPRILAHPTFGRAARTVKMLRKFYPRLVLADIDTNQLMIAQLRYAIHTLTFDEPNIWQRRWALYTASVVSAMLTEKISFSQELRVDWIPLEKLKGKLGLTLLPGRRDRDRKLNDDLTSLKKNNIRHIYSLITAQELKSYGVPTLMKEFVSAGIGSTHVDVLDGAPLKIKETLQLVQDIDIHLKREENVLIHCLGGLGRSGTLAAAYFIWRGMEVDEAIKVVRESRSARAIETQAQVKFLHKFKQALV
jgi:protein-tyrosine phosphatase